MKISVKNILGKIPVETEKVFLLTVAALTAVFIAYSLTGSSTTENIVLNNKSEIRYVEDNRIGSLIAINTNFMPALYKSPELEACIYTSREESPLFVDLESRKYILVPGNSVENIPLNLSLEKDQLERKGFNQTFSTGEVGQCPIRSDPSILVKRN